MYAKSMSINNNLIECKFIRSKKTRKMALKVRLFMVVVYLVIIETLKMPFSSITTA